MNTIIVITTVCVLVFSESTSAQNIPLKYSTTEAKIAFWEKNILMGLRSDNEGLIESSLILIARIKLDFPETNIAEVQTVIDSIAFAGSSNTLRYKAYLTSTICTNPLWFSPENRSQATEQGGFFLSASQQLQDKLFGVNVH
jgi:hypothetical protein